MREIGFLQTVDGQVETCWIPPRSGAAGTTALVLLHEGLGCVSMWRNFPERLAEHTGHGVFAYSRVGYGGSDPCALPRPLNYMHHDANTILPTVLGAIDAERIVLVGHSDGASIAAIYGGSEPDTRLAGLVLMAPHFFIETVSTDSIAAARDSFESGDLRQRLAFYHGDNVDCAFQGWNQAWLDPGFLDWDITPFLPAIDVPVLFIQGRQDQYGTLEQLAVLEQALQAPLTSLVLDNCRHSPHRDKETATLEAIGDFLGGMGENGTA